MWLIKCVHAMVYVCVCACLRLCVGNANMRNFVFWQLNQKWRVLKCKMFVCGSSCGAAEQSKRGNGGGQSGGQPTGLACVQTSITASEGGRGRSNKSVYTKA